MPQVSNYTLTGAENTSYRWTILRASIMVRADNKQSTAGEVLLMQPAADNA